MCLNAALRLNQRLVDRASAITIAIIDPNTRVNLNLSVNLNVNLNVAADLMHFEVSNWLATN